MCGVRAQLLPRILPACEKHRKGLACKAMCAGFFDPCIGYISWIFVMSDMTLNWLLALSSLLNALQSPLYVT